MADTPGQSADPLSTASALATQPTRFALFAALRLIEQLYPSQPRLGESRKAADDPVRLAQPPHLYFAPSDVASFRSEDRARPLLEEYSFGIFGPNGALPLHLTEYAWERMTQADDPTFADLINTFQHRFVSLFYRAWADTDPATNQDRPGQDRFETYVGSFLGLGEAAARRRDAVLDHAKLSRCAHFAGQARSAEALTSVLADYFELPIEVRQFIGGWLDIPAEARCRLASDRDVATLGMGATLGMASWQCQHKFEIVIGPLTLRRFGDFLPGARGLRELHALVRLYTNDEWSWQVRLLLEPIEIPGMQLGKSGRLGWTSWLGTKNAAGDDVVLQGDDLWSLGVAIAAPV